MNRIILNSKNAVLMIHGIVGTPHHFDFLLPAVPADCSIYRIWLPGHGAGVADFGHASMKQWRDAVEKTVEHILSSHARLFIVAHSMGCLFAIRQALERPDRIAGLFLLAVPLRPRLTVRAAVGSVRLALGMKARNDKDRALKAACGVTTDPRLWRYIPWIPRFLELFREAAQVRKLAQQVTVPCRIFQSRHDELVALASRRELEKMPRSQVTFLERSGHFYYDPREAELLCRELTAIFDW